MDILRRSTFGLVSDEGEVELKLLEQLGSPPFFVFILNFVVIIHGLLNVGVSIVLLFLDKLKVCDDEIKFNAVSIANKGRFVA